MFAILGATGQAGGATARHLLASNQQVRLVVRDPQKVQHWRNQGADIAVAEIHDPNALEAAFAGTQGAFVMTPPYYDSATPLEDNHRAITAIIEAAHESGLPKLVLLSSIGAHLDSDTGAILKLHHAEQQLFKLGIPVASIRAAWFMENFRGLLAPARQGFLPSMLAPLDHPFAMVATDDIGKLAASLLTADWPGKRILELEGPRRYSPHDVAQAFSDVLGTPVQAQSVPHQQWSAIFESHGMTPNAAAEMVAMIDGFNSGWIRFEGNAEHVTGSTDLRQVVAQMAQPR
jgi:NAD(P)H dehydrogenase (quinone)